MRSRMRVEPFCRPRSTRRKSSTCATRSPTPRRPRPRDGCLTGARRYARQAQRLRHRPAAACRSAGRPRLAHAEDIMEKLTRAALALAAAATAAVVTVDRVQAVGIAPQGLRQAVDELGLTENVQFRWGGHRYCW